MLPVARPLALNCNGGRLQSHRAPVWFNKQPLRPLLATPHLMNQVYSS